MWWWEIIAAYMRDVIIGHHGGGEVSSLCDIFAHDTSRVYSCSPPRRVNKYSRILTQCVSCKLTIEKEDNTELKVREEFPNEKYRKCFRRGFNQVSRDYVLRGF